jgi:hypothetical protein
MALAGEGQRKFPRIRISRVQNLELPLCADRLAPAVSLSSRGSTDRVNTDREHWIARSSRAMTPIGSAKRKMLSKEKGVGPFGSHSYEFGSHRQVIAATTPPALIA